MQCPWAILSFVACQPVRCLSTLFYQRRNFFKEKLRNMKSVFLLFLRLSPVTFLFLRRTEQDVTNIECWSSCEVPVTSFNEPWMFSAYFRKILKCQISWKSLQWSRVVPCGWKNDGRTDVTKQIVAFRNFENALKMTMVMHPLFRVFFWRAQGWHITFTEHDKLWI
jgi:hypothetical protein